MIMNMHTNFPSIVMQFRKVHMRCSELLLPHPQVHPQPSAFQCRMHKLQWVILTSEHSPIPRLSVPHAESWEDQGQG